jgi:hypothetical protein
LKAEVTTQADSNFDETEKKTYQHPFKNYYISGDPVVHKTQNRFEGRSNYFHYYPTDNMKEQKLEKIWMEARNREI